MSLYSGFFNSSNHDRLYDSEDIARLFDGLIRDGIFSSIGGCFIVKPNNGMMVSVDTGRAWFNHTWTYNDAILPITLDASEVLLKRIDAVVLEVNSTEAIRANSIKVVRGTPASSPSKPALTKSKLVNQYALAYITVNPAATSIGQADIENAVGTDATPFVSGILEVISIDKLIPQWKAILDNFVTTNTENFNTWMDGEKQTYNQWLEGSKSDYNKMVTDQKKTFETNTANQQKAFEDALKESKNEYSTWYNSVKGSYDQWFATIKAAYDANWKQFQQWEANSKSEFDAWFESLKTKLDDNIATKLSKELDDLSQKVEDDYVALVKIPGSRIEGTVESALLLGEATRNLLKPILQTTTQNGVTCTNNGDGTYTVNGTTTALTFFNLGGIDLINGETYKLIGVPSNYGSQGLSLRDSDGAIVYMQCDAAYHADKNRVYVHIRFDGTYTNAIFKPMLTTDLDATYDDFVPYDGYEIKSCGKNLLNYAKWIESTVGDTRGTFVYENNGVTITATSNDAYTGHGSTVSRANIPVNEGDTITLSWEADDLDGQIYLFPNGKTKENEGFITVNNVKTKSITYTVASGVTFIQFRFGVSNSGNTISYKNIQIEKGSTRTTYEPYKESTVQITQSTEFPLLGLKSFDGETNIISPGNVEAFCATAENGKYLLEALKKATESGGVTYGKKPTSPKIGDTNVDSNGILQVYTGTEWITPSATDKDGSDIVYSNTKPNRARATLWIDTGNGNTLKFVPANNGNAVELASGGYSVGADAPSNTKLLWIKDGVMKYYNGSNWVNVQSVWG